MYLFIGGCAHVGKGDCTDGSGCKTDCDNSNDCTNGEDESITTCKYVSVKYSPEANRHRY